MEFSPAEKASTRKSLIHFIAPAQPCGLPTRGLHCSNRFRRYLPNSSPTIILMARPVFSIFSTCSGFFMASLKVSWSFLRIGSGIPLGPMAPRVEEEITERYPSSGVVGTSGRKLDRSLSITANPRTCPPLILKTTLPTLSKETSTCPPKVAVNCWAPPFRSGQYGI